MFASNLAYCYLFGSQIHKLLNTVQIQFGSGSTKLLNTYQIWIRIHNTGFNTIYRE